MSETRMQGKTTLQESESMPEAEVLQPSVQSENPPTAEDATQAAAKDLCSPEVAYMDVSSLSTDTRIVSKPGQATQTDLLRPDVLEPSEEDRAADSLSAGDRIVLESWSDIMRATVARALAGNMDAVRELRMGAIEPHRTKVSRRTIPILPKVIADALLRLPVKYTPPADIPDAEIVSETPPAKSS